MQENYQAVSDKVSAVIARIMAKALNGTKEHSGILQAWTTLAFRVRRPDSILEGWRQDTKGGSIAFLAIAAPILLLITGIPLIYHVYKKI